MILVAAVVQRAVGQMLDGDAAAERDRIAATLTGEIEAILADTGIPSVSIALLRDGRVYWTGAFGYSIVRLKVPATPETIYSTGSCFKSVTAMAVMQLVERGLVKLDDPVNMHLGEHAITDLSADGKPVTIRHLLSHYSGLDNRFETRPIWSATRPRTLEEIAAEVRPVRDPEAQFEYSNVGYALAGLIIQEVSGESYERYIVDHFLAPVGSDIDGPVNPSPRMLEVMAKPYRIESYAAVPEQRVRFDVYPAGDVYLSAPAMAEVLLLHLTGGMHGGTRVLSEESIRELRTPPFEGNYALGLGTRVADGERLITHAGGVPGYSSHFMLGLDSGVGVYVVANAGDVHEPVRLITQMAIDVLRGRAIGTGLVREAEGIGAGLAKEDAGAALRIIGVVPGSPASRARLVAGQEIRGIDGEALDDKSLEDCLGLIRGASGTTVTLDLIDPGESEPRTVELTRGRFRYPT